MHCESGVGRYWTYVVARHLLFLIELRVRLVDTRSVVGRVATESHIQILEKGVASSEQGLGHVGAGIKTRLAVKDDYSVGEVCCLHGAVRRVVARGFP